MYILLVNMFYNNCSTSDNMLFEGLKVKNFHTVAKSALSMKALVFLPTFFFFFFPRHLHYSSRCWIWKFTCQANRDTRLIQWKEMNSWQSYEQRESLLIICRLFVSCELASRHSKVHITLNQINFCFKFIKQVEKCMISAASDTSENTFVSNCFFQWGLNFKLGFCCCCCFVIHPGGARE